MAETSSTDAKLFVIAVVVVAIVAISFLSKLSFQELISLMLIPVEASFIVITFMSIYRKKNEVEYEFKFDLMPRINLFFVLLVPVILWFQPPFANYQTFMFWLEIAGIASLVGIPYWAVLHYLDTTEKRKIALNEFRRQNENFIEFCKHVNNSFSSNKPLKQRLTDLIRERKHKTLTKESEKVYSQTKAELVQQIETKEQERQRRLELEEEQGEQALRLLDFFRRKKSTDSIPDWAVEFDESVIETATKLYGAEKKREWEKEQIFEEAKAYIKEHKAFPNNFSQFSEDKKQAYRDAYELYLQGKLISKEDVHNEDRKLFEKDFLLTENLSKDQTKRFIKDYGYRQKLFPDLKTGKGVSILVRNDQRKETDYHFCWKHLFGSLKLFKPEIEREIDSWRTDVAFIIRNKHVALEIESGTNNITQLEKKKAWLDQHFELWCFVCPRNKVSKYSRFVDKKQSFVFTTSSAYAWLNSLNKG